MSIPWSLFYIFIFPGILFTLAFAFFCQYVDRKLSARFQKRVGPPLLQPFADFIKLLSKEDIVPNAADKGMFSAVPIFGLAAVMTAFLYVPVFMSQSLLSFDGDLLMVLYLLTIPTLALFLAGWYSGNLFGQIGSTRTITQLISYEIPFFIAMLAPALIVGSLNLAHITEFQAAHYWLLPLTIIGFIVAIVSLQGKLERVPFDIPEAETEIVGGPLTEYSGRRLALFKLMLSVEMVVGAALIVVLFLGGCDLFFDTSGMAWYLAYIIGFVIFFFKVMLVVLVLALIKVAMARIRIDQMVSFSYKFLIPLALLQIAILLALRYLEFI